ncbi:competence protein CoiA [Bacillus licheniformis]|uniref:competence protein CoiA family protein n=1 Tax=Bacillus licheniformis TaxID=1402 RepID=UPI00227F0D28|nr:competence protein CoiA family protein [Bacillus licheniformis]MCY7774214.1 competence protein CoiA [Bacillus licheniformis]MCY7954493.1 competence protein CoiA [Bacillus licheniformis]MCY8158902.1 competence protein CoiA [Bacillus licheniformis]MCY8527733.1 competence protein CoiA [Bacillus licheniformis]MCY8745727.1 competence protein CoiA [Bacillus licheniformis]
MFSAMIDQGGTICLADGYKAEDLKRLRKRHAFYCPVCRCELDLKIGSVKLPHFAHKPDAACPVPHEPESPYHLKGKRLLYEWLGRQGLRPVLEPYLQEIRQKPDLLLEHGTRQVAVEFQCANLNAAAYRKRTEGFLRLGIEPVWILGGNRIKRLTGDLFQLSRFHWQFIQKSDKPPKLLFFCPEQKAFIILEHLIPFQTNKTSASLRFLPLAEASWRNVTERESRSPLQLKGWKKNILSFRMSAVRFLSKETKQIAALFYENHQLPLPFFPSEAFLPVPSGYIFAHPVYVWQGYLFLFITKHDTFRLQSALHYMDWLIKGKRLKLRWSGRQTAADAVGEYICFLHKKGFLVRKEEFYYSEGSFVPEPRLEALLKRDEHYFSE